MKRYLYIEHDNGTVNKIPISDTEYRSIRWDWQVKEEELLENYISASTLASSMKWMNDWKEDVCIFWDEQVRIAKQAYDDYSASINKEVY